MLKQQEFCVIVIGKEGVGKSQLISSLTNQDAQSTNLRGSTISCEYYRKDKIIFIDTPGIIFDSDSETTRIAMASLDTNNLVLLVIHATHIDQDLDYLLPLVESKKGAIIVTNWDRVNSKTAQTAIERLEKELNVITIPLDSRKMTQTQRDRIVSTLYNPSIFPKQKSFHTGLLIEPRPTILEKKHIGTTIGMFLLLIPSILSVIGANYFADYIHPKISEFLSGLTSALSSLPSPIMDVLVGDYGFVSMGPFLFVWAAPVVVIYALLLGFYKSTGLLDRISIVIHPLVKRIGISGRDITRIIMGFGCNVPAVISSRSCSSCSRGTTISAIGFGSACSYQFGASIAVFAASGMPWLVTPFLLYLTGTSILYTRLVSTKKNRSKLNMLIIEGQVFFERPTFNAVWRESKQNIRQFFKLALPIFFTITLIASILSWTGSLDYFAVVLGPAMSIFNLPDEASLAIIFGSIRKDGLLLLGESDLVNSLSPVQILTGVYLAGILLPCVVTVFTVIREMSWRFALKMITRQSITAIIFTLLLAHSTQIMQVLQIK
jgi:Fe2+ transport system protein B